MKKISLVIILMGVLVLQSCTMYRIKVAIHPSGATYYFPEKRFLVSDWEGVKNYGGDYTLEWARKVIEADKNPNEVKIKYIK